MRVWLWTLAALAACTFGATQASAQARLDCSAVPENVCLDAEVLALEGDRVMLVEQITSADPQSTATAGEDAWLSGLNACGEDLDCYRAAYIDHNQTLRQSVPATPETATPLEEPADAAVDEPSSQREEPASRNEERAGDDRPIESPSSLPGWGFFTALGVTLLILFWLLRARARNRDALRAEEAQLRDEWP
jgi:hypothetical protein